MHFVLFCYYFFLNIHVVDLLMQCFGDLRGVRSTRCCHEKKWHRRQIFRIRRLNIVEIEQIESTSTVKSDASCGHRIVGMRRLHLECDGFRMQFFCTGEHLCAYSGPTGSCIDSQMFYIYKLRKRPDGDESIIPAIGVGCNI